VLPHVRDRKTGTRPEHADVVWNYVYNEVASHHKRQSNRDEGKASARTTTAIFRVDRLFAKNAVELIIHLNQQPSGHGDPRKLVEIAVHNYFACWAKLNRLDFHHLLKQRRTSLFIGLVFLGACLATSEFLLGQQLGTLQVLARESLTIAGWVAMWRPMQIFLYEWWPLRRIGRIYQKMSRMHVDVQRRAG
jgi:hypothetical protein